MFKSDHSIQNCITIKMKNLPKIFFYCRILSGECRFSKLICRFFKKTHPTKSEFLKFLGKALEMIFKLTEKLKISQKFHPEKN